MAVIRSCKIKSKIVNKDEREKNLRMIDVKFDDILDNIPNGIYYLKFDSKVKSIFLKVEKI